MGSWTIAARRRKRGHRIRARLLSLLAGLKVKGRAPKVKKPSKATSEPVLTKVEHCEDVETAFRSADAETAGRIV